MQRLVMADEGNESRIRRMDLNLYLGLPRSPRLSSRTDLGSDLALGSLPPSSSTAMSSLVEASDTHASYNPDLPSMDPHHSNENNPSQVYSPYEPYRSPSVPVSPIELELEGDDSLYSPAQALPTVQENDELHMEAYDPMSPPTMADRLSPQASETHMPYLPSFVSISPSAQPLDEVESSMYQSLPERAGEFSSREGGSSSQQDRLRSPEFRFRRLIEVSHRLRHRRFWMSPTHDDERSNSGRSSPPISEQLLQDLMSSQSELDMHGKHELYAKDVVAVEVSDDETKEKIKGAATYECNICLDMAKEPVVTSCGHLFCWPCLFQWLHLHSDHRECPVCKGEVIESNIIPIYGRGSSESSDEKRVGKNEESCLKIPPRPRGNRFESFRQQFRPISRRLGEGIANSWRRLVDQRIRSRSNAEPTFARIYEGASRTPITRMRARRMQREVGIHDISDIPRETGLARDSSSIPQTSSSNLLFRDGDLWQGFSLHSLSSSERLAAIAADLGTVVGRFGSSSNQYAASTSTANPQPPQLPAGRAMAPASSAADQASASSTMAVIQGDVATPDAPVEPNSAGSSRSYRRRGRSSASGSLDVDGGALNVRKRRRPN